jgi:hypothetical protein
MRVRLIELANARPRAETEPSMRRHAFTVLLGVAVLATAASNVRAQCLQWGTGFGFPGNGTDSPIECGLVFDDGSGPALYVAGEFHTAGSVATHDIARWNGTSWSAVGGGVGSSTGEPGILAMAAFDDGTGPALYAGGYFTQIGGINANRIAKWNGSNWSALGTGVGSGNDVVAALAVFDDGTGPALYAGGQFTSAGGINASNIARWNGTYWSALGSGVVVLDASHAVVASLLSYTDNTGTRLIAGGHFTVAGNHPVHSIAAWDGTTWSDVGGGVLSPLNAAVTALASAPGSGEFYAGGIFDTAGGVHAVGVAKWNGGNWSALGTDGVNGTQTETVYALTVYNDGSRPALYVGGYFTTADAIPVAHIARWDGTAWSSVGGGLGVTTTTNVVYGLATYDDGSGNGLDLYALGWFSVAGGSIPSANIARWKGCHGPGVLYCGGDGEAAPCPCINSGASEHGCDNSAATGGALLSSSGTTNPDTLVLHTSGELPNALSIFLQGSQSIAATPFGDGLRCAGGQLLRLYVVHVTAGACSAPGPGDPSVSAQSANLGDPIGPGSQRYYQVYYRDPSTTFCAVPAGDTWNVTNGLAVHW